ncbi:hypothetical protein BWZ22_04960 [Seonamhaeicola sp. S2-3]|uniref:DUF4296 domain-containing protein n=1 Tax=Seonamhaeicola sp. S2-3 TaxID=1936081 RepID=UPI0009727436|nr:DUF4296 domain-containing protein [Seonamhaeicola sp. S2-3]APY10628.1 hypothetical protein BWZ22_04960 [Seonamhaeicola sp. S2-3]
MKLKPFLLVFILILFIGACTGGVKKPKNLISKDMMVNILIDAKLITSANTISRRTLEENGVFPDSYIFNKYGVDSAQFAQSNAYYTYKVKDYEEIYTLVKDSLDKLKAKYKALQEQEQKEKKIKDSLKAIELEALSKKRDSLKTVKNKDSLLVKTPIKTPEEEGVLINPVSEK